MFHTFQVVLENYTRFVGVLFLYFRDHLETEYGTRKEKRWELSDKSQLTELTSREVLKKTQFYHYSSRGKFK